VTAVVPEARRLFSKPVEKHLQAPYPDKHPVSDQKTGNRRYSPAFLLKCGISGAGV